MNHLKHDAINKLTWEMVYANEACIKCDLMDLFKKIGALRWEIWRTTALVYNNHRDKIDHE